MIAKGVLRRMRGLVGRARLEAGEGLYLPGEPAVHMFFMRFPIDVVFVNEDGVVLKVARELRPWHLAACRRAKGALELASGSARAIDVGDTLKLEPLSAEARAQ